jgi:hypothetical protein
MKRLGTRHATVLLAARHAFAMLAALGATIGSPASLMGAGQQGGQKKSAPPSFVCPDPLAVKACNSFSELRRAGDDGVRASVSEGGIAYVCFRQPEDEFFVFALAAPIFRKTHLDPQTKKRSPDDDAVSRQTGFVSAYVNGIADFGSIPLSTFSGDWRVLFGSSWFEAQRINNVDISDPKTAGLSVDPSQVYAAFRYKNRFDKDLDYRLVIQRSTGRFSETYTEESAKVPFSEKNGRCSRLPPN